MTFSYSASDLQRSTHAKTRPRATFGTYISVWQQRRELARMDVSRLKDLGISQADALAEAARPFWDLPCLPNR